VGELYVLNATVEVVPLAPERFELRVPLWGRTLEATRYQVGLLQQFDDPAADDAVLARYPFHRDDSVRFLAACIREGVLLPIGADGAPRLPSRTRAAPSMFAAPPFDPAHPAAFVFLGVPFDRLTTGAAGTRLGPHGIRAASEAARYRLDPQTFEPMGFHDYASGRTLLRGITLADAGDVFVAPGESASATFTRVTEAVREITSSGAIPLIAGGDHSITHAVLGAFPPRRMGVIHLDAHTDLGTPLPGAGIDHGNVFTCVLEDFDHVEKLVQVGLRGLTDASEKHEGPHVIPIGMDVFRAEGIAAAIARIPPDLPYYLSVDIDVLDPSFAPSTGTPVPNGLFPHELKAFVRAAAESREIIGCDLVEVAEASSGSDPTQGLAAELLLTVADAIVRRLQGTLPDADTLST
jgi:agmatinase